MTGPVLEIPMLPQPLIEQYWRDVADEVAKRFQHPRDRIVEAIAQFRQRLVAHGVGDIQYHADIQDAAEVIDRGIRQGFPDPFAVHG